MPGAQWRLGHTYIWCENNLGHHQAEGKDGQKNVINFEHIFTTEPKFAGRDSPKMKKAIKSAES